MTAEVVRIERPSTEMVSARVDEIVVEGRHRVDLGDLSSLARSIDELGLLNPITVTPDLRLIAGHRRLEACRMLGRPIIRACVVRDLDTAQLRLMAERDENVCRMEMRPSEAASLGLALEELERPKAADRRTANLPSAKGQNLPVGASGKVNEIVGPAVGMSHETYRKAKNVLRAGRDGVDADGTPLPEPVAEAAREALAEMDATGKVSRAFKRLADAKAEQTPDVSPPPSGKTREAIAQKVERARQLAATGHTSRQIATELGLGFARVREMCTQHSIEVPADAIVGAKSRRIDPERVVEQTVSALSGLAQGLDLIEGQIRPLDAEKRREWLQSLAPALAAINRLKKELEG